MPRKDQAGYNENMRAYMQGYRTRVNPVNPKLVNPVNPKRGLKQAQARTGYQPEDGVRCEPFED